MTDNVNNLQGVEDLQKARWYLDRLISNAEDDHRPFGVEE